MKHRLICILLAVALWALPVCAQAEVLTPELFRLQVVARSDSEEDQALKLQVRDAMVALSTEMFAQAGDATEAYRLARQNRRGFEQAAAQVLSDASVDYEICVEVGEFEFPDRIYGGVAVPAGTYRALRVTLGEGTGHNWWCVLYPTLCRIDESALEEDGTITFYSCTLDFLEQLFGGDAA